MARYAEADDVAQHVRMWTDDGHFTGDTNPTNAQVESWLDSISRLLDSTLASYAFEVPITDDDVVDALKLFTENLGAYLAHQANKAGEPNLDWFSYISNAIAEFVKENALGFENMGANRLAANEDTIEVSETDASGDTVHPIFQREQHGNRFENWDT
jgi:hypothetical protein